MNDQEYEINEARKLARQLAEVSDAPLSERREARKEMFEAMGETPEVVAERVGWLLNGSYGWGACRMAKRIMDGRGNKPAALVQLVGALEWRCPENFTREAWNGLKKSAQVRLNKLVEAEIKETECAIA